MTTSEYERQRVRRLLQNYEHMVALGLHNTASSLAATTQNNNNDDDDDDNDNSTAPKPPKQRRNVKPEDFIPKERPRRNVPVVSFKPVPRGALKPKPLSKRQREKLRRAVQSSAGGGEVDLDEEQVRALWELSKRRSTRIRTRPAVSFVEYDDSYVKSSSSSESSSEEEDEEEE